MKHRGVVLLGVFHQTCILFRKEKRVPGVPAVTSGKIRGAPAHFHPLTDDFILTALVEAEAGGIPVGLCILAIIVKAGVTIARAARSIGVNLVQKI